MPLLAIKTYHSLVSLPISVSNWERITHRSDDSVPIVARYEIFHPSWRGCLQVVAAYEMSGQIMLGSIRAGVAVDHGLGDTIGMRGPIYSCGSHVGSDDGGGKQNEWSSQMALRGDEVLRLSVP